MRWDYRDNASRWREVEALAGLSTPNGLKDFNRATDNRMDATFLTLPSLSGAARTPGRLLLSPEMKHAVCERHAIDCWVTAKYLKTHTLTPPRLTPFPSL